MDYTDITTELTRKEFVEYLIGNERECCLNYNDEEFGCPSSINLKDYHNLCYDNCKECWIKAIKNIKFKDKINNQGLTNEEFEMIADNVVKEYNKNKVYKASEIVTMIENGQLEDDDVIIALDKEEVKIGKIRTEDYSLGYFLDSAPFTIKVQEPVNFSEAVLNDKHIKVNHELLEEEDISENFHTLSYIFSALGSMFESDAIREIIKDGQWFIEE